MDGLVIRTVADADLDAVLRLDVVAFHLAPYGEEQRARELAELATMERVGAYDGTELVGFAAARDLALTVPGGELACAGVTFVGVLPTHRRRGALRALMGELLERAAADRRPIAALWAAEGGIYGRYGFGAASRTASLAIDGGAPLALRIAPSEAPLRLLDGEDALAAIRPLHDELRLLRPGRPARDDAWWAQRWLLGDGRGRTPVRTVVVGHDDAVEGYATYRTGGLPE